LNDLYPKYAEFPRCAGDRFWRGPRPEAQQRAPSTCRRSGSCRCRSPSRRVTGPRKVCVSTSPVNEFGAPPFVAASSSSDSGRINTRTRSPFLRPLAASTRNFIPLCSTSPLPPSTTVASSRFIVPMNSRDERGRGGGVHLRRRAHLLDHAAVHDRHVVGDRERLLLVVASRTAS